jgi:hypothetical protein
MPNIAEFLNKIIDKKAEIAGALTPDALQPVIDAVKEAESGAVDGGAKVVDALLEALGGALSGVFGAGDDAESGAEGDAEAGAGAETPEGGAGAEAGAGASTETPAETGETPATPAA